VLPPGTASATIPVTIEAGTVSGPDATFSLVLDGAAGIGLPATFVAQQTYPTGLAPFAVAVADLNGDGKPDVIVADASDNDVTVYVNTTPPGSGTPTFSTQTFDTGAVPLAVVAVDIDRDGKLDLVVADQSDNAVSILLNTTPAGSTAVSFEAELPVA